MKTILKKYQSNIGKWINANQVIFLAFFAIAVVTEVYTTPYSVDGRLFGALLLYWWFAHIGKLVSTRVFQLVLVLLFIMFLSFLANGASLQTERLAVWYVLFFAFGIIQKWRE